MFFWSTGIKREGIVNGRIARQATDDYYLTGFNFPFRIPSQLLHKFTRTAHTFLRRICTYLNRLFYSVNVFTIVVAVFFCTFVWKKGQTTYIGTHCMEHFFGNCAFSHYKRTCVEITSSSFLLAQDFGLARERWKTKTINNNIEPTKEKTGEIAKHTHEKMNIWPIKTYFRMSSLGNSFIPKLSVCVCVRISLQGSDNRTVVQTKANERVAKIAKLSASEWISLSLLDGSLLNSSNITAYNQMCRKRTHFPLATSIPLRSIDVVNIPLFIRSEMRAHTH